MNLKSFFNDTAERGIEMISDYAQTITKDESQRQALLQVVQEHRIQHPGQSKSNFLNMISVLLQIQLFIKSIIIILIYWYI